VAEDAVTGAARRGRLAQRRKELGLTQEALAHLLGVERSTVVRWERGETEPLPWIRPQLAKAMRVTADRLDELLVAAGTATDPDAESGDTPGRDTAVPAAPRQLPATATGFTGRAAELQELTRILDDAAGGAPGTVVISAIGGTAGVGKTALALHWAHQVAGRFGDGQLYVNLRGFDPSGAPASPAEAIGVFLDALGVPPGKIPPLPDAQAGMYRSLVADRKMLIVLDNARDEQQVRPLLPASPASLVLVTSRNQLAGLASTEGARLVTLDVLTQAEAVQLLTSRLGARRAGAEPDAVREIADLCACLPLALAVAGARATARPGYALAGVAEELRDAEGRLDALDSGDPAASVRAVFSWSYQQLSAGAARMFRLLGLHPGPDISVPAAASLVATGAPEARRLLRELTRAHLITEHVPGRYAFHDLLRAYAAAQASDTDSEDDRAAATHRLLDHYLHTASAAVLLLEPTHRAVTLAPLSRGAMPEPLADDQQAMTWFEAEHQVLLRTISLAGRSGYDIHAWQLPSAMSTYLERRGHWHEQISVLGTGLAAATRLGDTTGQVLSCLFLGNAYILADDYGQADAYFTQSLELCRRADDRRGQAMAHANLGVLTERQGRYADSIAHSERALHLFQAIGNTAGEAQMLNNIGYTYDVLGDYEQARAFCRRSLAKSADLGYRDSEAHTWDSLGSAEHHLGNFTEAADCYERALSLFRELGDRYYEANSLGNLGDTWRAAGDPPRAREAWQHALAILDDLGHADADKVREKLASRDGQDPGHRRG
jgi:tetratricopeptide (TPR) repeat protein/transcriptional regulator with XRE-family HTH domain